MGLCPQKGVGSWINIPSDLFPGMHAEGCFNKSEVMLCERLSLCVEVGGGGSRWQRPGTRAAFTPPALPLLAVDLGANYSSSLSLTFKMSATLFVFWSSCAGWRWHVWNAGTPQWGSLLLLIHNLNSRALFIVDLPKYCTFLLMWARLVVVYKDTVLDALFWCSTEFIPVENRWFSTLDADENHWKVVETPDQATPQPMD